MARGLKELLTSWRERRRARQVERVGYSLDRGEPPPTAGLGFQLLALAVVALLAVATFVLSYNYAAG